MPANNLELSQSQNDVSERELLASLKSGDADSFRALFERNKDTIYSLALRSLGRREDAEDVVQEVFYRAWRSIGAFRGDAKLLSWLCRIAVRLCIDHARMANSNACSATDAGLDESDIESIADPGRDIQQTSHLRHVIAESLKELPLNQRMLVVLCDVQGFSCKEAAVIMGCSAVSARVRLCRAHRKLRRLLSDSTEEAL